jgi:hypothetical protein
MRTVRTGPGFFHLYIYIHIYIYNIHTYLLCLWSTYHNAQARTMIGALSPMYCTITATESAPIPMNSSSFVRCQSMDGQFSWPCIRLTNHTYSLFNQTSCGVTHLKSAKSLHIAIMGPFFLRATSTFCIKPKQREARR